VKADFHADVKMNVTSEMHDRMTGRILENIYIATYQMRRRNWQFASTVSLEIHAA